MEVPDNVSHVFPQIQLFSQSDPNLYSCTNAELAVNTLLNSQHWEKKGTYNRRLQRELWAGQANESLVVGEAGDAEQQHSQIHITNRSGSPVGWQEVTTFGF